MTPASPRYPLELEEALGWVGHKLDEIGGATAGRVEGVLVDVQSGEPAWLLIRLGRLGRRSAVPFQLAAGGVGHVWVPYPKRLIKDSPEVDPGAGLDHADELELCDHYGVPPGVGRRAELEGREGATRTAVPASR